MTTEKPPIQSDDDSKKFIEELRNDNLTFYEDARGKGAIANLSQTFPYRWIYIAELIQNALDVNATRLSFKIIDDRTLLFEHDGIPFNNEDVRSLCTRGVSTKSVKTIGFMGVGFKSVFKSYEKVEISSSEWKFFLRVGVNKGEFGDIQRSWLGCVLPEPDASIESPSNGMTCRFLLSEVSL